MLLFVWKMEDDVSCMEEKNNDVKEVKCDFFTSDKKEWSELREEFRKTRLSFYIHGLERSAAISTLIVILITLFVNNDDISDLIWGIEILFGGLFEIIIRFMYYVFLREFAKDKSFANK